MLVLACRAMLSERERLRPGATKPRVRRDAVARWIALALARGLMAEDAARARVAPRSIAARILEPKSGDRAASVRRPRRRR